MQEAPSQTGKQMLLTVRPYKAKLIKLSCSINGVTALWNGPNLGYAEVRSINFACTSAAGSVTVKPSGIWTSVLTGTAVPLADTFSGVKLHVNIAGSDYGTFAGTLAPRMGDSDPEGAKDNQEGKGDDLDTLLFFQGERLTGANGSSLSLTGWYGLGSKAEGATGEVR